MPLQSASASFPENAFGFGHSECLFGREATQGLSGAALVLYSGRGEGQHVKFKATLKKFLSIPFITAHRIRADQLCR